MKRAGPLSWMVVVAAFNMQGCFLLVSSGIRREIPSGAEPAAVGLLHNDEVVVAAWDGSVLQDGGLLVVLTDRRLLKKDADSVGSLELGEVQTIVVNEDEGAVDVVTLGALLRLPLRSSDERRAFAHLVQSEVHRRKKLDRSAEQPISADPVPAPLSDAVDGSLPQASESGSDPKQ